MQESKLHVTLNSICKTSVASKDHKSIAEEVGDVDVGQKAARSLETSIQGRKWRESKNRSRQERCC
jgi:hypothetical protein